MKKSLIAPAIASALALTVAGCAKAPDATPAASGSASSTGSAAAGSGTFKACMVSDEGGFDDKSFNQTSHDGLEPPPRPTPT